MAKIGRTHLDRGLNWVYWLKARPSSLRVYMDRIGITDNIAAIGSDPEAIRPVSARAYVFVKLAKRWCSGLTILLQSKIHMVYMAPFKPKNMPGGLIGTVRYNTITLYRKGYPRKV